MIPDDRARQGPPGRPVLGVLIGALLLAAVAVAGYMIWVGSTSPDDPGTDASRARRDGLDLRLLERQSHEPDVPGEPGLSRARRAAFRRRSAEAITTTSHA